MTDHVVLTQSKPWGTYPKGTQFTLAPIAPDQAKPGDLVACCPARRPDVAIMAVVQADGTPETFHRQIAASRDNIAYRAISVTVPMI